MSTVEQLPEVLNLHIRRGDSFTRRFHFSMASVDLDVSAWTIAAQVREYANADDATDFTIDDSDAVNGNVDITLTDVQTAAIPQRNEWDFEVVIDGYRLTLFAGSMVEDLDVTRA